jgi:hypothetical protein
LSLIGNAFFVHVISGLGLAAYGTSIFAGSPAITVRSRASIPILIDGLDGALAATIGTEFSLNSLEIRICCEFMARGACVENEYTKI